jgi:hypothetical protein
VSLIWVTRGRTWGFRFLRDGGFQDPLPEYDRAFAATRGQREVWRRVDRTVALRFPDPEGRTDFAGRVIPHDFVLFSPLAERVASVDDGLRLVWPLVADEFQREWDQPRI